mmetsp:Transcript_68874/g.149895  ORF Transcript_68874/g.149895 Transcript_68874/m.149895 type:complete len:359 (+) Transcript_68874:70-1146(+)
MFRGFKKPQSRVSKPGNPDGIPFSDAIAAALKGLSEPAPSQIVERLVASLAQQWIHTEDDLRQIFSDEIATRLLLNHPDLAFFPARGWLALKEKFLLPCPDAGIALSEEGMPFEYITEVRPWHLVPIVNVFYDLLMDSTPTCEQLTNLLNLISLVDALLLAVAMSIPGSVDFEGLQETIQRFNSSEAYGQALCGLPAGTCSEPREWMLVNFLGQSMGQSIALLGGSLLSTLVVYACLISTNFSGPDGKMSYGMMGKWWLWVRVAVLYALATCIWGIAQMFGSMKVLTMMRFPDFYAEQGLSTESFKTMNTVRYVQDVIDLFCYLGVALSFLVASIGLAFKTRQFVYEAEQLKASTANT